MCPKLLPRRLPICNRRAPQVGPTMTPAPYHYVRGFSAVLKGTEHVDIVKKKLLLLKNEEKHTKKKDKS